MIQIPRRDLLRSVLGVSAAAVFGRRCQGAAWVDRRSYGPFQCVAEYPLDESDRPFGELSRLESELERTLGLPPASQPVEVFLLANEAAYRAFLQRTLPHVPYRRALYVRRRGRGAVYAYRHPDLAIDLRHECTHALLHANVTELPLWLDEGLAEYFEMAEADRAFGHPHLATLRWNLRLGMSRSIESLESERELADMRGVEYRFAWAWVHFMLHGPTIAHRALVEYLADARRGEKPGPLSARLRAAAPELEMRMTQHFLRWERPTAQR